MLDCWTGGGRSTAPSVRWYVPANETVSPREPRADDPNNLLQGGLALLDGRVCQPQLLELTGHIAAAQPEHQTTVGDGVVRKGVVA